MPRFSMLFAPAVLAAASLPVGAAEPNPQIDYDSFVALTASLAEVREAHRLPWPQFIEAARANGAILLDTRSAAAFEDGHIAGAINLPFSDFTADKLADVLGPPGKRPVYIYCNNNFRDDVPPVALKRAPLALNIPTFINLHGYGYTEVWELADQLSIVSLGPAWTGEAG